MDRDRAALSRSVAGGAARVLRAGVPLAFLSVFFAFPVAAIVGRGLLPGGRLDLTPLADVVGDPGLRRVAWFTLWQAAASTVLTLALALPGAYALARYEFPGRRAVRALVTVPFVLPTVVVGSAFVALLGRGGPLGFLGWQRSVPAILAAHVFFNYAVVVRTVGTLWAHLDPRLVESARVLGATRAQAFRAVTLPLLAPAIAAAGAIVFLFTFTSFGVVLVLGGPARATLEVEIWRETTQLLDLPVAAALAVLQMAAVVALLVVLGRLQARRAVAQRLVAAADAARRPRSRREWAVLGGNLAVMAALLGGPLAVLVGRSFTAGGGLGLQAYRALGEAGESILFVPPLDAVRNSVVFAAAATAIALVVGGLASFAIAGRKSRGGAALDTLLMLPLGTSAVTVGFGFLVALDDPPLDLRSEPVLVPLAHAVVAIPFVVRAVVPVLRSIDPRLRDAAAVLGAPPARVWWEVDLPIVRQAVLVAAGFAAAVSLGEFGATVFVARPDAPTLPVAIFRYLGRPGEANFGQAMALSTVLMALTAAAILAVERVRVRQLGEF